MRLIDAEELIKGKVENDPVRIAVECTPTAFDKEKVLSQISSRPRELISEQLSLFGNIEKYPICKKQRWAKELGGEE